MPKRTYGHRSAGQYSAGKRRRYRRRPGLKTYQKGYLRRVGYYGAFTGRRPERKFVDTTVASTASASAGAIASNSLNIIAEGNGESQRTGRRITVTSIMMRGVIRLPQTSTASESSDIVRVIVYQDKQTNGAAATVTGILESADYRAFNNLANRQRFKVIKDMTIAMNQGGGSTAGSINYGEYMQPISFFKKCRTQIEYDNSATTGAITTQRSNNFGVLVISRDGTATFEYTTRLRYEDY